MRGADPHTAPSWASDVTWCRRGSWGRGILAVVGEGPVLLVGKGQLEAAPLVAYHSRPPASWRRARTSSLTRLPEKAASWRKHSKRPVPRSRRLTSPAAVPTQRGAHVVGEDGAHAAVAQGRGIRRAGHVVREGLPVGFNMSSPASVPTRHSGRRPAQARRPGCRPAVPASRVVREACRLPAATSRRTRPIRRCRSNALVAW